MHDSRVRVGAGLRQWQVRQVRLPTGIPVVGVVQVGVMNIGGHRRRAVHIGIVNVVRIHEFGH